MASISILQKLFGTKLSYTLSFILAGLAATPLLILDPETTSHLWVIPISVFLSRFGTGAGFGLAYALNAEAFPSIFAATSIGVGSAMGTLVTILAP